MECQNAVICKLYAKFASDIQSGAARVKEDSNSHLGHLLRKTHVTRARLHSRPMFILKCYV